ncbi:MAG: GNAT family N-acetyltransferase [Wujia sp.]
MIKNIYMNHNWGVLQEQKENGKSYIYKYESKAGAIKYPFIVREAAVLNGEPFFDIVTPRGEGGPLVLNKESDDLDVLYDLEFNIFCQKNNIIAEYIRFDPWNTDENFFSRVYNVKSHGFSYCHRLQEDFFMTQYSSKRRNQIRKAINNGVKIDFSQDSEKVKVLLELYKYTAEKHNISDYYTLDLEFLERYFEILKGNVYLGIAYWEDIPIAAAMFLNGGDIFHYHFSASHPDYTDLNAISLLLMEAAKVGQRDGCKLMDLGGATPGSGLEIFKRSLTKSDEIYPCYIGTKIRNKEIYNKLVELNGCNKDRFPEYR